MKINELDDESLKRSTYKLTHGNYRMVQRVIASVKNQSGITLSQAEVINLLLEACQTDYAFKTSISLYVAEIQKELKLAKDRAKMLENLSAANPELIDMLKNVDPDKLKMFLQSS